MQGSENVVLMLDVAKTAVPTSAAAVAPYRSQLLSSAISMSKLLNTLILDETYGCISASAFLFLFTLLILHNNRSQTYLPTNEENDHFNITRCKHQLWQP